MLPSDFTWEQAIQWRQGPKESFRLDGTEVARMSQRVDDGSWFVTLDRHLGWDAEKRKTCTSYEQGCSGVEKWATRHEQRLRQEVAERRAKDPRHRA